LFSAASRTAFSPAAANSNTRRNHEPAAAGGGGSSAPSGYGDIDPAAAARAAAASAAVAARYAGLIEEVSRNLGLTPEQRATAINSYRQRQAAEAADIFKAIMGTAQDAARARREMQRREKRGSRRQTQRP